ncbi:hypothetical protein R4B61_03600 [Fructilactobacillus vespulae]|uniref:hypothetical protein n=1 Tax=Fructilactobacillus vespulae TaxID=1249630 RepID=UPI0039B50253
MSDNLSFTDLNEAAQAKVAESFIPFYVKLFKNQELDVMTTYDFNHVIAVINRTILDVSNKIPSELYHYVLTFDSESVMTLIKELPQTYFENGNPTTDWDEWYVTKTNEIDPDATL